MPTDTLPLWREARAFLVSLFALFGGPEKIVAQGVLMPREARLIQTWLRSMEIMLRQLLLIEAAALPKPDLAPSRATAKRPRAKRTIVQDPDAPETWRVRFRLIEPVGVWCKHRTRTKAAAKPQNPWPLAERFEAALRVFNDPAPYVQRLARKLARAPRLAALIFLTTISATAPGGEILAALVPLTDLATAHFNPSG